MFAGSRHLVVGATSTTNKLYRYVAIVGSSGTWTDGSGALTWLATDPIAATTNTSDTIASIFGAHNAGSGSLGMLRWNGSSWSTTNLSRPSGKEVCDSITASQGQLGISSGYRVAVACTPQNGLSEIYVATATSDSSTTFTWTTHSLLGGGSYVPAAVSSVLRAADTFNKAIDIYVLGHGFLLGRLNRLSLTTTGFTNTDLGLVLEADSTTGSMTAIASGFASRNIYTGGLNGLRFHLYERWGGSAAAIPQNYRAFGDEFPDGATSTNFYAEGKISNWHGTAAISVMRRPGPGDTDWPEIHFIHSSTDGESLGSPQLITKDVDPDGGGPVGTVNHPYTADPTAAVTDARKMYSMQLGVIRATCTSTATTTRGTVYAVSTTNGSSFSAPIVFDSIGGSFVGTPIDHPYMEVQRRDGVADIIHATWWNREFDQDSSAGIRYGTLLENSSTPTVVTLRSTGSPPRITVADRGKVIIYHGGPGSFLDICEVNAAGNGCVGGWQPVDSDLQFSTPNGTGPGVSGASIHMRAVYPASMAISESADVLYYCYHKQESNGPSTTDSDSREETDVFCSTATRNGSGTWVWDDSPVSPAGVSNDNKDQFAPEVVLTNEQGSYGAGQETLLVTWYDRSDDSANYLYKVKKAVSTDRVTTFHPPRTMFNGVASDPEYLPRHCFSDDIRFIGDYSGYEGDLLHARSLMVTVPTPGTVGTVLRTNFNALGSWAR